METIEPFPGTADRDNEFPGCRTVRRTEGLYVWFDGDTEPYVDLVQGFSTTNWGHRHAAIISAAHSALEEIDHVSGFSDGAEENVKRRLLRGCGFDSGNVYFDVGGAQIVRMALHAAMSRTGRVRCACLRNCFHGYGCSGSKLADAFLHPAVPRPACGGMEALDMGSPEAFARVERGDLAAVLVEPYQGAAGFQQAPPRWLRGLAAACAASGTLFISDEIQMGLGRTGTFAALEHAGVQADMYVFSKALGGGIFPISALVARDGKLPDHFSESRGFGSTFSNNQLGMRVASAALQLLDDTLSENVVARKGFLFRDVMQRSNGPIHDYVGIRCCGLAIAIDFNSPAAAAEFHRAAFADRILCHISGVRKDIIKIFPPLNLAEAQIVDLATRLCGVLAKSLPTAA